MKLTITGLHMDTGATLKTRTEEKMEGLTTYFDKINDVHVVFVNEPHHQHLHKAEVRVHANGIVLQAEGTGIDWYGALDDVYSKLQKQLEKYKGRLQKHRERRAKYAKQLNAVTAISIEDHAMAEDTLEDMAEDLFAEFAPEIVKKEVSRLEPMSVDEAVMQMDLLHKPAFLFLNARSGELNMVYREQDRTVRWIAPKAA